METPINDGVVFDVRSSGAEVDRLHNGAFAWTIDTLIVSTPFEPLGRTGTLNDFFGSEDSTRRLHRMFTHPRGSSRKERREKCTLLAQIKPSSPVESHEVQTLESHGILPNPEFSPTLANDSRFSLLPSDLCSLLLHQGVKEPTLPARIFSCRDSLHQQVMGRRMACPLAGRGAVDFEGAGLIQV